MPRPYRRFVFFFFYTSEKSAIVIAKRKIDADLDALNAFLAEKTASKKPLDRHFLGAPAEPWIRRFLFFFVCPWPKAHLYRKPLGRSIHDDANRQSGAEPKNLHNLFE